jgi:hypothetical protein
MDGGKYFKRSNMPARMGELSRHFCMEKSSCVIAMLSIGVDRILNNPAQTILLL